MWIGYFAIIIIAICLVSAKIIGRTLTGFGVKVSKFFLYFLASICTLFVALQAEYQIELYLIHDVPLSLPGIFDDWGAPISIIPWKWGALFFGSICAFIGNPIVVAIFYDHVPIKSKKYLLATKIIGITFATISYLSILSLVFYGLYWVWYFLGGGIAVEVVESPLEKILYGGLGLFLLFDLIVGLLYIFRR